MALIDSEQVAHAYRHQAERAFDDATFLWLLRSRAADQPHYDRDGLMALDWRLNNLLDVLVTMPQQAWELCARALPTADAGEIFVASASAYRGGNVRRIQEVVEAGLSRESTFVGLVSALAWLPRTLAQSWIQRLLRSRSPEHRHLAIAACSWRRESPACDLAELLNSNDCAHDGLYCRTLRLIGELKCFDLRPAVERAFHDERPDVKFWAHWAAALLGSAAAAHSLHWFVTTENPHRQRAVDLCMRLLPMATARQWISALAKDPAQVCTAIWAIAALGDPVAVDWLLPRMRVPATARLAGEALFTITGIDLVEQKLTLSHEPDQFTEDHFLPEPDPDAVTSAWQERRDGFVPGQRFLLGKTLNVPHLERVFANGRQRQRRAAAIELALAQPQRHLLNHAVVPEFS